MAILKYKNPNYVEGGSEPMYLPLDYFSGIEEAPKDNTLYARQNGEWKVVDSGMEEAPIDGLYYVRKDGEWIVAGNCPITLIVETNTGDNTDVANVVFTVTIDGVPQLVNNGSTIMVEHGKAVKIECPNIEYYYTPASVEFTTELFLSYTKTFTYTPSPLGVFILDKSGKLWAVNKWDTSNNDNVNAIAVITNNVKVLVALTDSGETKSMADSPTAEIDNYCTSILNETLAKLDYKGKNNTRDILMTVSSTNYAAGWANAFTFPDGTKGHLPSLGEFWEVYKNKAAVDAALTKCGGTATNTSDCYWCSTFWGINGTARYCWSLRLSDGGAPTEYLSVKLYVRAFATIS